MERLESIIRGDCETSKVMIHYIEHKDINFEKWDACVANSFNRLIYGFSWYLDVVCDDWDALVLNDYEAVFPLPKRKKWGIEYICQPFFCQKLGVFSKKEVAIEPFLNCIPKQFKYLELNVGSSNCFVVQENSNYELAIVKTVESYFSKNTARNISKAKASNLSLVSNISLEKHISLFNTNLSKLGISQKDLAVYVRLCYVLITNNAGKIYAVFDEFNNLVASSLIAIDAQRIYYLNGAINQMGRNVGASHWMIAEIMKSFSGKIFDFEGSNIEGVARFYLGFGAKKTSYPTIKINRLPFYLKWVKS